MPGFRTHYFFGQKVAGAISDDTLRPFFGTSAGKYPKAYNLGLQGPDIFFYGLPSHFLHGTNIGVHIHHADSNAFFAALIDSRNHLWKHDQRRIADAYILGFLGHHSLDSTMHPYVHYRTKFLSRTDADYTFGCHVLLETDIDVDVLRHYAHRKPSEFHCHETIDLPPQEAVVIASLLWRAIRKAYPASRVSYLEILHCFWSTRQLFARIHDTNGKRKAAARRLDSFLRGYPFLSPLVACDGFQCYPDPCNRRNLLWENPWNPSFSSTENVYAMIGRATDLQLERSRCFARLIGSRHKNADGSYRATPGGMDPQLHDELMDLIGHISYDTGLPTA